MSYWALQTGIHFNTTLSFSIELKYAYNTSILFPLNWSYLSIMKTTKSYLCHAVVQSLFKINCIWNPCTNYPRSAWPLFASSFVLLLLLYTDFKRLCCHRYRNIHIWKFYPWSLISLEKERTCDGISCGSTAAAIFDVFGVIILSSRHSESQGRRVTKTIAAWALDSRTFARCTETTQANKLNLLRKWDVATPKGYAPQPKSMEPHTYTIVTFQP